MKLLPSSSTTTKHQLLLTWFFPITLLNIFIIILQQYYRKPCDDLNTKITITLQQQASGNNNNNGEYLLGWEILAELLGPNPRILVWTMLALRINRIEYLSLDLFLVSHILTRATRWTLGLIFHEPRPFWEHAEILMLHCTQSFGFPSGHVSICLCFIFQYFRLSPHATARQAVVITIWFILMCLGRIFLGTHSWLDLIFGISIALLLYRIPETFLTLRQTQLTTVAILGLGLSYLGTYRHEQIIQELAQWHSISINQGCTPPNPYGLVEGAMTMCALVGSMLLPLWRKPKVDWILMDEPTTSSSWLEDENALVQQRASSLQLRIIGIISIILHSIPLIFHMNEFLSCFLTFLSVCLLGLVHGPESIVSERLEVISSVSGTAATTTTNSRLNHFNNNNTNNKTNHGTFANLGEL
jgi:membrane-associated phospholipid phosphatase